MKISERTIGVLAKVITGDSGISPYNSGPKLVKFFNEVGFEDRYGQGFPSRWAYVEDNLRTINGKPQLATVISSALDPRAFLGTDFKADVVAENLNQYLKYDGFEIVSTGKMFKVRETRGAIVDLEPPFKAGSKEMNQLFIDEQIQKCDRKIMEGDFDGAITNARSLLEGVLIEMERQLDLSPPSYDGDLPKLFKRVQALLNLDPSRKDVNDTIRQILVGLTSIVMGLAGLRNKMSDAHAVSYKPQKHHAKFAVNSAKTAADFIFETFNHQLRIGKIKLI